MCSNKRRPRHVTTAPTERVDLDLPARSRHTLPCLTVPSTPHADTWLAGRDSGHNAVMAPQPIDVVIVGGRPAGAAAARLLAACGRLASRCHPVAGSCSTSSAPRPQSTRQVSWRAPATRSGGATRPRAPPVSLTAPPVCRWNGMPSTRCCSDSQRRPAHTFSPTRSCGADSSRRSTAAPGRPQRGSPPRPATQARTPSRRNSSSTDPAGPASSHAAGSVCTTSVGPRWP